MSYSPANRPPGHPVLRSPAGLATAVTVLLGLAVAIDLFSIYADLNVYALTGNLASATDRALDQGDALYTASERLQIVGMLATAAVFIVWFYRVRVNAAFFSEALCTMGRGWAVGAWFVPIGNLWLPYRVAREVWVASAQSSPDRSWRQVSTAPVTAWWTAWVATVLAGRVGAELFKAAQTTQALRNAVGVVLASHLLGIAAAGLAILFVGKLSRMQQVKPVTEPVPAT